MNFSCRRWIAFAGHGAEKTLSGKNRRNKKYLPLRLSANTGFTVFTSGVDFIRFLGVFLLRKVNKDFYPGLCS